MISNISVSFEAGRSPSRRRVEWWGMKLAIESLDFSLPPLNGRVFRKLRSRYVRGRQFYSSLYRSSCGQTRLLTKRGPITGPYETFLASGLSLRTHQSAYRRE